MNWLITYFKSTFPGIYGFFADFFKAMNNRTEGQSLKKWLAVGTFWLIYKIVKEHTTDENLEYVLTALLSTMLTLAGIYTVSDYKTKKLNIINKPTDDKPANPSEEATST